MIQSKHSDHNSHNYKIVLVGDSNVGKTHLISRFVTGTLPRNPTATIGIEYFSKNVPLESGETAKVNIWDTAGMERHGSVSNTAYRRAAGAMLVFDVTKRKTFENLGVWLDDLRNRADQDIVITLIGNKTDLCDRNPEKRDVSPQQALQYAQSNGLLYVETSALTASNVKTAFEDLVTAIYNQKEGISVNQHTRTNSSYHKLENKEVRSSCGSGCCK